MGLVKVRVMIIIRFRVKITVAIRVRIKVRVRLGDRHITSFTVAIHYPRSSDIAALTMW